MKPTFYRRCGKRTFDVTFALLAGLLLLPILAFVTVLVRMRFGSPVIFRQQRIGRGNQPFSIFKFRTMTDASDGQGNLLPDEQRLTRFGRFLRSTSLDELPTLWNVLRGQMSLVGPRPLLPKYLPLYTPEQARRHEVRPGITGWAQVNGRNMLDWQTKFKFDVWYVDHCSFSTDVWILCKTIGRVLRRDGISAQHHATSPEFQGSPVEPGIVVIGAGGHAKVVIATLQASGHAIAAVYDDRPHLFGQSILGIPIQGPVSELHSRPRCDAVIAIGDNRIRAQIANALNLNWVSVVHPAAQVHHSASLGPGAVAFAGAVVQPDTTIGAHAIINTSASVDHDCSIGDFAHVAPGARLAGSVTVGDGVLLGIGSVAIPGITIGRNTTVGAGAVVVDDLPAGVTAVGCPARVVGQRTEMRRAS